MAEAPQSAGELPVKRPREEEEENGGVSVDMEMNNGGSTPLPESMSSVIPGWFSEISPMWPGDFLEMFVLVVYSSVFVIFIFHLCVFVYFVLNLGRSYYGVICIFFRGS